MEYREILDALCRSYKAILAENLVGFYVHGSIALGCFHPQSSDIDFICVVREEPTTEQKADLLHETVRMSAFAPQKGLEMHILRLADCQRPQHPVYFCLHYSNAHAGSYVRDPIALAEGMHGNDPDLAAHLTIMHAAGLCIEGPAVSEVFGLVPKEAYLDSILEDVFCYDGDAVYTICNLCRVWGYLESGEILSKHTGPAWALANETEHYEAVETALSCYDNSTAWPETVNAEEAISALRRRIHLLLPAEFAERYSV